MSNDFEPIVFDIPNDLVLNKAPITLHTTQSSAESMKRLRDKLLNDTVDRINPIWYASLSEAQKQELATYRQALLDIPQQSGFPINVAWPNKPSWL